MQLTQIYRNIPRISLTIFVLATFLIFFSIGANAKRESINKKLDKNPQNVNLRLALAKELEDKNLMGEARGEILTALNFDSNNPYALNFLNEIGSRSTDLSTQIEKTQAVTKMRPDYQQAWAKLAILYEQAGNENSSRDARIKSEELKSKL